MRTNKAYPKNLIVSRGQSRSTIDSQMHIAAVAHMNPTAKIIMVDRFYNISEEEVSKCPHMV
jgi:hypothetical protein